MSKILFAVEELKGVQCGPSILINYAPSKCMEQILLKIVLKRIIKVDNLKAFAELSYKVVGGRNIDCVWKYELTICVNLFRFALIPTLYQLKFQIILFH